MLDVGCWMLDVGTAQGLMFSGIRKWASFVKLSHTVFALPFALASMVVAARDNRGWPGWRTFGLILAAMVCARARANHRGEDQSERPPSWPSPIIPSGD